MFLLSIFLGYFGVFAHPDTVVQPQISYDTNQINGFYTSLSENIEINPRMLEIIDSLTYIKFYQPNPELVKKDTLSSNNENYPVFPDSVLEKRIKELNFHTLFEIPFNKQVKNYIEYYSIKNRTLFSKILGLSEFYFPLFEEYLDRYQMPLELKYLPVVESALNPTANSRAGAKGLWQFMYSTGKMYGLKSTSLIDDRFDPIKSTDAACRHLKDLYEIYDNWALALAAYNSGPGNVNKALRRAGGVKSYWAIWPFLPKETRGYVPAFIAVMYLDNYADEHRIYPLEPDFFYVETDTVMIKDALHFDQVSEVLEISTQDLFFLNPTYKSQIIPATADQQYILRLPAEFIPRFVDLEDSIYAHVTQKGLEKEKLLAEIKKAKERNIHIVRYGENLGLIANKYHTSVKKIMSWNNLRSTMIYPGQKLVVYGAGYVPDKPKPTVVKNNIEDGDYVYHVIRKGDTLWDIAQLYDGVSVYQLKKLNNISNTKKLKPGQKLIIQKKS